MAHEEETKDFNAMLHKDNGMPRIQRITDAASIQKYGGDKMYLAPPLAYDHLMENDPPGPGDHPGRDPGLSGADRRGRLHRPHHGGHFCIHRRMGQRPAHRRRDPLLADPEGRRRAEPQVPRRPSRPRRQSWKPKATPSSPKGARTSGIMSKITKKALFALEVKPLKVDRNFHKTKKRQSAQIKTAPRRELSSGAGRSCQLDFFICSRWYCRVCKADSSGPRFFQ